ncbi:MAG TPA: YggT family protein, partial [Burkholderiales bacterium]|nr:YggT family protein [Burkholderiales bacterium]
MFDQIAQFLIRNLFELFIYVVLLRFWMQALRAPFRNPIGQFVIALTDWAVAPLRRVIPAFRSYDLASFAVAWLAQILKMIALYAVASGGTLV